jgi:hypothetical protein
MRSRRRTWDAAEFGRNDAVRQEEVTRFLRDRFYANTSTAVVIVWAVVTVGLTVTDPLVTP